MLLSRYRIFHSLPLRYKPVIKYSTKEYNQAYIIIITIIVTHPCKQELHSYP